MTIDRLIEEMKMNLKKTLTRTLFSMLKSADSGDLHDLDHLARNGERNMNIRSNTGNTETFYILN